MSKQEVVICHNLERKTCKKAVTSKTYDKLFILTDEHTRTYCLPIIEKYPFLAQAEHICIGVEDIHKNLETLAYVWSQLSNKGGTRHSLMINLGGGMITDLGGFAAATFKRGIDMVNIPTTLLAMVDASVGGKTGINFNGLKNEIGVFAPANYVLIDCEFLKSLDYPNILSGYAEMLKHGLISNTEHWSELIKFDMEHVDYKHLQQLVATSIEVKSKKVVEQDPFEQKYPQGLKLRTYRRSCIRKFCSGNRTSCIAWICRSMRNGVRTILFTSQGWFPPKTSYALPYSSSRSITGNWHSAVRIMTVCTSL